MSFVKKHPSYVPSEMSREQLLKLIREIDRAAPRAGNWCDEPGITIGEAVYRELIDNGNELFTAQSGGTYETS